MLVSTVVESHNGGWHCTPARDRNLHVERSHPAHTTLAALCRSRYYTAAVEHRDCGTHDQRACVALVRNMDCATAAATDSKRATPLSNHEAMAIRACVQRNAQTRTIEPNQCQVALRSRTSAMGRARCSNAHRTEGAPPQRCVHFTAVSPRRTHCQCQVARCVYNTPHNSRSTEYARIQCTTARRRRA
jgi:hypothetical protein